MTGELLNTGRRAALEVAHPGHELRVHGWLERARPLVFILTDGSGHTGQSRLASTATVLERAGATPGPIYGRLRDRDVYRALLDHRFDLFTDLADELTEALDRAAVEMVVGDAVEGFNPGHDVCRLVLNAAVERLAHRTPANYELPLEAAPDDCPTELRGAVIDHPPFYEVHGEKQVAEGVYTEVLRFREHVAPLAERLAGQAVARETRS